MQIIWLERNIVHLDAWKFFVKVDELPLDYFLVLNWIIFRIFWGHLRCEECTGFFGHMSKKKQIKCLLDELRQHTLLMILPLNFLLTENCDCQLK